ncbi:NAD(P)-dependent oxidoreductase [Chitinophaga niabensis]|uniref:NAD-dependent epimerase/dehydratase family protein n=1 Tax=Chitinophaga niabensis TaxID=536979 RepID=UPI0031BAC054
MSRIFVTGATGFLGATIVQGIAQKHDICALKRHTSDLSRINAAIRQRVHWVNMAENWQNEVARFQPDVIIHAAWIGVEAAERNDWKLQLQNIGFLYEVMELAVAGNVKKIIALGSQAEYGNISGIMKEDDPAIPTTAYGAVKTACSQILQTFGNQHQVNWYWLRLFSFFGEGENENWLIPSVIKKIITTGKVDLTPGMQAYAYLYVKDLVNVVEKILQHNGDAGIYNISSNNAIKLRDLVEKIKMQLGLPCLLNFGAVPYRDQQPMHVQGDIEKFESKIGSFNITAFETALIQTIDFYRRKYKTEMK